jgi:hypothetical protein
MRRRLSKAQAAACENAKRPQCVCRCGGALHGAGHHFLLGPTRAALDELPADLNRTQRRVYAYVLMSAWKYAAKVAAGPRVNGLKCWQEDSFFLGHYSSGAQLLTRTWRLPIPMTLIQEQGLENV